MRVSKGGDLLLCNDTDFDLHPVILNTAVLFNVGNPSAVSRSWQMKAALPIFPHYKVPLTFWYSWTRLRNRRSKNLIKFSQVYIAFVLRHVQCFEKKTTYWLNESWKTRLPKRLKCTIAVHTPFCLSHKFLWDMFFLKKQQQTNKHVYTTCSQMPVFAWYFALPMGLIVVIWFPYRRLFENRIFHWTFWVSAQCMG